MAVSGRFATPAGTQLPPGRAETGVSGPPGVGEFTMHPGPTGTAAIDGRSAG